MVGFAPAAVIDAPPRLPLPYGLFSVVSLAESATERWENGVTWESVSCSPVSVIVGDCETSVGFPLSFPAGGGPTGDAVPFTVYGTHQCSTIGMPLNYPQEQAQAVLINREQQAAELAVWQMLDDSPAVLTGTTDPLLVLAKLERWMGDNYGSLGILHMSRRAATVLAVKGFIEAKGSQMLTKLGTPVVVGAGYPGTGVGLDEAQRLTASGTVTGGTFTLTFGGQTTAPIAWDATAAQVHDALTALSNIESGDVAVSGGPLPGSFVTVSFGGAYADTNVAAMTVDDSGLTGTTPGMAVTTTTEGGVTPPAAEHEYIALSPALFGYRSEIFSSSGRPGDLIDRGLNNSYGIAERNYLIGMDPCGVAMAAVNLG